MEKMQITVSFEILSCDGCLADYIINLAVYTMTVGNIVLRDTVTSATCCLTADDRLVLDPTNDDLKDSKGHVRVAVSVQKDKIFDFSLKGLIREGDDLKDSLGLAISGAKAISSKVLQSLVEKEKQ